MDSPKKQLDLIRSLDINPNKPFSNKDANDLLKKYHDEADEEVETNAFGLETSDGKIVKVYVHINDAETFEKTLASMLGQEDDIQEVIDKLADDFDIVSVEWPDQNQETNYENNFSDEEPSEENTEENPEEENEKSKFELDFNINDKTQEQSTEDSEDTKDKPEDSKEKPDSEAENDEEEKSPEDIEKEFDDILPPAEETDSDDKSNEKELDKSGEEESEDESEDSTEDESDEDKTKDKKKKKKVKESLLSSLLSKSFLTEKQETNNVLSKKEIELDDVFKTVMQQKIVKLLFLLDFPVDRLLMKKSLVRKSIREKALELNNSQQIKNLITKLITDLSSLSHSDEQYAKQRNYISHHTEKDLEENLDTITNDIQKVLINLYQALGVPEKLVSFKPSKLKQDLRKTAQIISHHNRIKQNLFRLAKLLEINTKDSLEESIYEEVTNISQDQYVNLVVMIAQKLGIPEDNILYKKANLINSVKQQKQQINFAQIKPKLVSLVKSITTETISEEKESDPLNLGNWTISDFNNTLILSNENIKIKIKDKELFLDTLDNGHSTYIKDHNTKWYFKAIHHGKSYIIINDDYPNGIILPKHTIENILDHS